MACASPKVIKTHFTAMIATTCLLVEAYERSMQRLFTVGLILGALSAPKTVHIRVLCLTSERSQNAVKSSIDAVLDQLNQGAIVFLCQDTSI